METIRVESSKREQVLDITRQVQDFLARSKARSGLVTVYSPHTTAGITSNENADPDVKRDILWFLNKTVPTLDGFAHGEGNSDAHIKSLLTGFSQTFIVEDGRVQLGTWQGIYFMEYDGPRHRDVWLKFISDKF